MTRQLDIIRRSCLLGAALVALSVTAHASDWSLIPSGTASDLLAIQQGGDITRVVGRDGYIGVPNATRTAWSPAASPTTNDLYSVLSQSVGQVWVGSELGSVHLYLVTNWNYRGIPNNTENFVLISSSSMAAFAAGSAGSIYYTSDAGNSWYGQASGTTNALHAGLEGFGWSWIVGDNGTIVHTRNNGITWITQPSGTTANLYGITRTGSTNIAVGAGGVILRSTDNGDTWQPVPSGTGATLRDVRWSAQDGFTLYAVGDGGTVVKSVDQGQSWCRLETGSTARLNAVIVPGNLEAIAAGDQGVLLRTVNGGGGCLTTGVEWTGSGAGVACRIAGPTPSPVVGRGDFRFAPARDGEVEVSLYDAGGRRVAGLFHGFVAAGESRAATVSAARYPPGVYFLRVRGEGFDVQKRVVIAR